MYKIAKPFFIIVKTPLHAGSETELGIVDMPIQRERHTSFPKIEASGVKGCLRDIFENKMKNGEIANSSNKDNTISLSFGSEQGDGHAGALGFTDARILLFHIKSMKGVFAWITCPMVLERFKADLELCKNTNGISKDSLFFDEIPLDDLLNSKDNKNKCIIANKEYLEINENIILEEYAFEIHEKNIKKIAEFISNVIDISEINNKLVILSNNDFRDFVNHSTEVITRIKIKPETGTVEPGALFTEEYLPAETVMYSLVLTTPIFNKEKGRFAKTNSQSEEEILMDFFEKNVPDVIQIGGNATIGKGIAKVETWSDKK